MTLRQKVGIYSTYLDSDDVRRSILKCTSPEEEAMKKKHVDRIMNALQNPSYNAQDLFKVLEGRMEEYDWRVAFKSLILIHLVMRQAPMEKVYMNLRPYERILNVVGFSDKSGDPLGPLQVKNLSHYAQYLEERAATYRLIQNDVTRSRETQDVAIAMFRSITTDEPLLDDISQLQRQLDALLNCKYALVDMDNVITLQSFRLLCIDLKFLFHVLSEAVIPLLERFFEMKKKDAQRSLEIYKLFVRQTEKTVEFFDVAKKLKSSLNVDVPTLKQPPSSLAQTLENYIRDPDFEKNRQAHIARRKQKNQPKQQQPEPKKKEVYVMEQEQAVYNDVNVLRSQTVQQQPRQDFDFFGSLEEEFGKSVGVSNPNSPQGYSTSPGRSQGWNQTGSYGQQGQYNQQAQYQQYRQQGQYNQAGYSQNWQGYSQQGNQNRPGQMQPFQTSFEQSTDDGDWAQFDKAFPTNVGLGINQASASAYKPPSSSFTNLHQPSPFQSSPSSFQTTPTSSYQPQNTSYQPKNTSYQASTNPFSTMNRETESTNPFGSTARYNPFDSSLDMFDPLKS